MKLFHKHDWHVDGGSVAEFVNGKGHTKLKRQCQSCGEAQQVTISDCAMTDEQFNLYVKLNYGQDAKFTFTGNKKQVWE